MAITGYFMNLNWSYQEGLLCLAAAQTENKFLP